MKKIAVLAMLVLIVTVIYIGYRKMYDIHDFSTGSDTYYEIVYSEDKQNYYYLTEERFSELGASVFGQKYIVYPVFKEKIYYKGYIDPLKNVKRFDLWVYDMNTQEMVNQINIKKYLKEYSKEWQLWSPQIIAINKDERYYAMFYLEKIPQKTSTDPVEYIYDNTMCKLYIDIESGESFLESHIELGEECSIETSKIWLKFEKLLRKNGCEKSDIRYIPFQNQLVQISLPVTSLPLENKKLYQLFPSLKEVDKTSGLYVRIYLTNKKDDLELIELLMPDGQKEPFGDSEESFFAIKNKHEYDELEKAYIEYKKSQNQEKKEENPKDLQQIDEINNEPMSQEEINQKYWSQMQQMEEEWAEYEREWKKLEEYKEYSCERNERYREGTEILIEIQGDGPDSREIASKFELFLELDAKEIQRKEESLQKEFLRLESEMEACERWYEEACRKIS